MAPGLPERIYAALAPWLLLIIESLLVAAAVTLTLVSQRRAAREKRFLSTQSAFARLARRKTLAVILVGLSTLAIRVALIPVWRVPQPAWHDEFSYLLAADTFAHGRVTNPTHPMWMHFEGFHIIQQPTYMSMYPPGQGLVLAAGQVLGHPWIGQLLITALMCSTLCWMLQGWLPPRWALLGASLAMLRVGILSYWVDSYRSASLPALGGALVLGALSRIRHRARISDAALMGIGLSILANTRPFEGLVFSLPIAAAMLAWISTQKAVGEKFGESIIFEKKFFTWTLFPLSTIFRRIVLPLILILGATGGAMGYYFWRVTGNAFVMPYEINRETYAVAPYFIWQKPRPEPIYRHAEMRNFYIDIELRSFESGTTVRGFLQRMVRRAGTLWAFYTGPVFTLPFLAFPALFRDRKMRLPLIIAAVVAVGTVIETWTFAHYLAPASCLYFLFLVQCIRHLRLFRWRGKPIGHGLARAIPLVCVAMIILRVVAAAAGAPIEPVERGNLRRIAAEDRLRNMPGPQLVIVHYSPSHIPHVDWVYNRADIDGAKIVWARDMGQSGNQELLDYFNNRRAWTIEADDPSAKLEEYGHAAPPH